MKNESIISALLAIRAECIREGAQGQEHAEALLRLRGYDPAQQVVQAKYSVEFGRGQLRRAILAILSRGPARSRHIATEIAQQRRMNDVERLLDKVQIALSSMKRQGLVRLDRRLWSTSRQT
jgi:hypothetical protein